MSTFGGIIVIFDLEYIFAYFPVIYVIVTSIKYS